jgi:putative ABC transport system permease protein
MHDVRYALRAMRRAPGFTAVTIPSLSPGIGANPAIFSLTNTLMLQPLPVRSPGELVQFLSQYPDAAEPPSNSYAWKYYERFRDETHAFSELIGVSPAGSIFARTASTPTRSTASTSSATSSRCSA